jgi:phosphonate transport system substrate-binding protein
MRYSNQLLVYLCLSLILLLAGCNTASPPSPTPEPTAAPSPEADAGVIVLGDIGDNPAEKIERFQPLADYLAAHLADYGISVGEVRIAPDFDTMISWIEAGEVDLYFDSLFPIMMISNETGAQPILRRWKGGDAAYHSVIFTRADGELASIEDLTGQIIGFEEAFSTSGYMLPTAHLLEAGIPMVEVDSPEAEVPGGQRGLPLYRRR